MSEGQRPRTIEEYAALQIALTRASREEVLTAFGIDEAELEEVETEFQNALSSAMDEDGEGVPALLMAYDAGLRKARSEGTKAALEELLSLKEFADLTRALEMGRDVAQVFASRGVTFERYLRASEHWTPILATNDELAQELTGRRRK